MWKLSISNTTANGFETSVVIGEEAEEDRIFDSVEDLKKSLLDDEDLDESRR